MFHLGIAVTAPVVGPAVVWLSLAVLRMEIECGVGAIVQIEIKGINVSLAFVGNSDERVLLEGHGEETVQRALWGDRKKLRLPDVIVAETQTKKVAEGSFDTRRAFMIPIHTQHELFQVIRFAARQSEPDVGQGGGTIDFQNGEALTWRDLPEVGIPSGTIEAGHALEGILLRLGQILLRLRQI